ncbi:MULTISPECIES: biotin/lipoyl-binding carrier protein [unclassified Pseudonocardia]|jgi:biotin carboxyl carrier protein|uniref:biotin/lipoyl-binding carrier protein n=1 Tax=unclassified Pseudonocardia TaxID=2619320 RepID=UPI000BFDF411|nr:biotin/lipoyl-binding carrier protein [Pseudonocardia sp. N23]GAY10861.1 biotin carboxyl carrier protein [Pseudonocardia sp. N23]
MIEVRSEIAAIVFEVAVEAGQQVSAGDMVVVLESMKMEIPVEAPASGSIARLCTEVGASVAEGDLIAVIA